MKSRFNAHRLGLLIFLLSCAVTVAVLLALCHCCVDCLYRSYDCDRSALVAVDSTRRSNSQSVKECPRVVWDGESAGVPTTAEESRRHCR